MTVPKEDKTKGGLIFVKARVKGEPTMALVDTGATNNSLAEREATRLGIKVAYGEGWVKAVDSKLKPIVGVANHVPIQFAGWEGKVDFIVVPMNEYKAILGFEFLDDMQCVSFQRGQMMHITQGGKIFDVPLVRDSAKARVLSAMRVIKGGKKGSKGRKRAPPRPKVDCAIGKDGRQTSFKDREVSGSDRLGWDRHDTHGNLAQLGRQGTREYLQCWAKANQSNWARILGVRNMDRQHPTMAQGMAWEHKGLRPGRCKLTKGPNEARKEVRVHPEKFAKERRQSARRIVGNLGDSSTSIMVEVFKTRRHRGSVNKTCGNSRCKWEHPRRRLDEDVKA